MWGHMEPLTPQPVPPGRPRQRGRKHNSHPRRVLRTRLTRPTLPKKARALAFRTSGRMARMPGLLIGQSNPQHKGQGNGPG